MVMAKSNATALLSAVVSKGLTFGEASKMCGVSADLLGRCARYNKRISVKTAGRLKKAIGDDVIILQHDDLPTKIRS